MLQQLFSAYRSVLCCLILMLGISVSLVSYPLTSTEADQLYLVGTGIGDFTRLTNGKLPHQTGTYGYVHYHNPYDSTRTDTALGIINGVHLPLKSRVVTIRTTKEEDPFVYVLFDLNCASNNLREGILKQLRGIFPDFPSEKLLLAATHTHSAPGGFSDHMGYELAVPGYRPDIVETIVESAYQGFLQAQENEQPTKLVFNESVVPDDIPIAFSRNALPAYNLNPEVEEPVSIEENYKATDRIWQMISFERNGKLHSMLNFFGAHPNRMGANVLCADTRGAASTLAEAGLPDDGLALFAQNAPGDIDAFGYYGRHISRENEKVHHPAFYGTDKKGKQFRLPSIKHVWVEGEFLKEQALETTKNPSTTFDISGAIDCELIYVDMSNQEVPRGSYAKTLDPLDYYDNDYFLLGNLGRFGAHFRPKMKIARTAAPTIGLGAIARIPDRLSQLVINLELTVRYSRLILSPFNELDKTKYLWSMYRAQGRKTSMLEGGKYQSAMGFRIGGGMYNIFARFDPVLKELARGKKIGLHEEHTLYPTIVPIQIVIIGNIAIAGVSGEPGNIAGQRIENTILEHLRHRGVKRVIVNGYANENTGYIFTPEEYESQFMPTQCGFVLYGKWTCPAFRYNFGKVAQAMLKPKEVRRNLLDYAIQPPVFSDEFYEKASFLEFLPKKE